MSQRQGQRLEIDLALDRQRGVGVANVVESHLRTVDPEPVKAAGIKAFDAVADVVAVQHLTGSFSQSVIVLIGGFKLHDERCLAFEEFQDFLEEGDGLIGAFQTAGDGFPKVMQGSAWWFNDHITGMSDQLKSFAALSCLGNFVGMLTDSRSFLSYTRHDYFRRILCDYVGGLVERGEYPDEEKYLKEIIYGISYQNAVEYFGFEDLA